MKPRAPPGCRSLDEQRSHSGDQPALTETSTLQSQGPDLGFILVWLGVGLAIFLAATALTWFVAVRMRRRTDDKRP